MRFLERVSTFWRYIIAISVVSLMLAVFFWTIIVLAGFSPRRVATWTFVVIWFVHLLVGAGAGYAAWRLWTERANAFVGLTMVHLHAAIVDAIGAIVLLFLGANVRFTWKFSIGLFTFALLRDVVRMPLILYIIRGPHRRGPTEVPGRSGDKPPQFWREEFRQAIRDTLKDEFLKYEDKHYG